MTRWLSLLLYPRWLFHGPHWWRSANGWWLQHVWGPLFFYRDVK